MAPNGTPVYHDAADGFKPKTAKNPGFLLVFRNSRIRDRHVNDCRYAMKPAGTMPAASLPGGPGGPGRRAWPNGPTRAAAGRRGGDAFLAFSPRTPPGRGGQTRNGSAATHHIVSSGPRAPPMMIRGRSGPEGGHDARPTRPGRPGPSPAEPAAGMTRTRGGPAAGAGRHREGAGAGCPRAVELPNGEVCPRQRVFVPAPTGPSWPRCVLSPASCRLEVFHRRATARRNFGLFL